MRAAIFSGGTLDEPFVKSYLKEYKPDCILAADRGLEFCHRNRIRPDIILGDFDSIDPEVIRTYEEDGGIPIRRFNPVKDTTDTAIAMEQAAEMGAGEICFFGATGTRLDHTLSNIYNLYLLTERGILTLETSASRGVGDKTEQVAVLAIPPEEAMAQVTPRRRDALFDAIREQAVAWSVASVSEQEIDELDILNARIRAMELAIEGLEPPADFALVDGNRDHGSRCAMTAPHRLIVKGDSRSASIAAASILAKVSRDRYMEALDRQYPQYGFSQHKGYGTKLHYQMLDTYGPSPVHRKSFLKKWEAKRK